MQKIIKRIIIIALCLIATAAFMLFASCGQSASTSGGLNSNGSTTNVVTPEENGGHVKKDESLLPEDETPSKPSNPVPSLPDGGDDENGDNETGHVHVYDVMKAEEKYLASAGDCYSKPLYYYSCECGETSEFKARTFEYGDYVHEFTSLAREEFLKTKPTCTTKAVYYKSCELCRAKSDETFEGETSQHNFDKQVVDDRYLADAATCWSQARYYYSCECGEKDVSYAFSAGENRAHEFSLEKVDGYNYNLASDATCEKGKVYYKRCAYCPEYSNDLTYSFEYGDSLGHVFNQKIETEEHCAAKATCTEAAKYYVSCERCGKNDVKTFVSGSANGHNYNADEECLICHIKPSAGIVYKVNGETAYVESYGDCTDKDVVLRSKYNGKPVTKIADKAFFNCTDIKSVTIKDGVTSIGVHAFKNCGCLKRVDIPDTVTEICEGAFYNCVKLTDVVLPEGLTTLQGYTFANCRKLYSLVIPDSVTAIGGFALYHCNNLRSLTIGSGLELGTSSAVFGENVAPYYIAEIINKSEWYQETIYKKLLHFTKTGERVFNYKTSGESDIIYKDGFMFYDYGEPYLLGYAGDVDYELVLPDYDGKDYRVYDYAFYGQSELISLTIGKNIISIGVQSFGLCYKLVNVNDESDGKCSIDSTSGSIPNYVKKDILREGDFIFIESGNDYRLISYVGDESEITLPSSFNGKKYCIEAYAFEDCYGLKKIDIGNGVTEICGNAFYNCKGLVEVTMGDNVKVISACSFMYCEKLQNITLGENLETIGENAFAECLALKTITIPDKVTALLKYTFENCVSLETVVIGEGVTSIYSATFNKCENITSLTFKNYTGWSYHSESDPSTTYELEFTENAEANAKIYYYKDEDNYGIFDSDLRGMILVKENSITEDPDLWGENDGWGW